jgi:hypothetical protein
MPKFQLNRRKLIGAGLVTAGAAGLAATSALAQQSSQPAPTLAYAFEAAEPVDNVMFFDEPVTLSSLPGVPVPGRPIGPPLAGGAMRVERIVGGPFDSPELLNQELASAKVDRDAVASKGDVAAASALLQTAEALIGQATPALQSSDQAALRKARGQAQAAGAAIRAARAQLEAVAPGALPSMQVRASAELVGAHGMVSAATAASKAASSPDASALVSSAQALYRSGYDAFQAAQYDRAASFARAAANAAMAARALLPPPPPGSPSTPAAVPAPSFG